MLLTAQARQFGTRIVDEDGMLELIRTLPGKKSKYEVVAEKEAAKVSGSPWCQTLTSPGGEAPSGNSLGQVSSTRY